MMNARDENMGPGGGVKTQRVAVVAARPGSSAINLHSL
jgi:hypothetical protein